MLRPISAQPFLPLFPPSYPLPNRICRILQSFSQETGMSEHKARCLLGHAPYIPANLQEKVPNVLLIHPFNFHSVWGNSNAVYAPDVLQTHTDSLLK